ncbi:MAG: FAD:protein FMN transferase [Gammaproteobacteria bacterium]|nr:FAD:protein FMN transferase [Gammaproteobacteria bacterium]
MNRFVVLRFPLFLFSAVLLLPPLAQAQWIKGEEPIMGTSVRVELWHEDRARGEAAVAAVMAEMHRIDKLMSPFIAQSELSHINQSAADHPVVVSRELLDLIKRSLEFSVKTSGSFDITFASAGFLYDYRRAIKPTEQMLETALPAIDYRHVIVDDKQSTVSFTRQGVIIDLGGIAKGHAVDQSIAILRNLGIEQALVSAGGDSRILGDKRGRPWMIGVRDPRNEEGTIVAIPLTDSAISTSGDYERYFELNGVRYHHILSPVTGKSVKSTRSVSILGPNATTTDALSTSVFVLGPKRGLALIESLPGIEAVIVDKKGRVRFSSGLNDVSAQ